MVDKVIDWHQKMVAKEQGKTCKKCGKNTLGRDSCMWSLAYSCSSCGYVVDYSWGRQVRDGE